MIVSGDLPLSHTLFAVFQPSTRAILPCPTMFGGLNSWQWMVSNEQIIIYFV